MSDSTTTPFFLSLRIRFAYVMYVIGFKTRAFHPLLRWISKTVPVIGLPLLIVNFLYLFTATDEPMYFSMAFSCGLLFFSAYIFPVITYVHDALRSYSADQTHYETFKIYESPEYSAMADQYWRARLRTFPDGQYVYIVKDSSVTGYYKIGKTSNPSRRLNRFDVTLPFDIQIVSVMPCSNMHNLEAKLHYLFKGVRVRGEWFQLSGVELTKAIALEGQLLFVGAQ